MSKLKRLKSPKLVWINHNGMAFESNKDALLIFTGKTRHLVLLLP